MTPSSLHVAKTDIIKLLKKKVWHSGPVFNRLFKVINPKILTEKYFITCPFGEIQHRYGYFLLNVIYLVILFYLVD